MPAYQTITTADVIAAMTRDGYGPRQIADHLKISTQGVYYHLKRLGLSPAQPSKAGS